MIVPLGQLLIRQSGFAGTSQHMQTWISPIRRGKKAWIGIEDEPATRMVSGIVGYPQ